MKTKKQSTKPIIRFPSQAQLLHSLMKLKHYEAFMNMRISVGADKALFNSPKLKAWRMNVYFPMFN